MVRWSFILLAAAFGICQAADPNLHHHWATFKKTFKKEFQSDAHENQKRLSWERNVKSILEHNLAADMGVHSYKKAVNEYTDWTQEEIVQKLCGFRAPANRTINPVPAELQISARAAPASHDWRNSGAVTSVKNQQTCGSCWTFAVAGALEGAWAIKTGQAVDLSEQQLLDCSANYGTQGCGGGWPNDAYKYVKDFGIERLNCYGYENVKKQCRYNSGCVVTKITDFYDVPKGDEATLKEYLYKYGPISVAVYVNDNFSAYSRGVFIENNCNQFVNHAVLLVGYGTENGQDYWTIKNSWGANWGENGYIRIARNRRNMCGIADFASFPYI